MRQNNLPFIGRPNKEQIDTYWRSIFETEVTYNEDATWIPESSLSIFVWAETTPKDIEVVLKKTQGWKCPGKDKIPNFWLKNLPSIYQPLANVFNKIIKRLQEIPNWLTLGKTYLIPKAENIADPKNDRPIT